MNVKACATSDVVSAWNQINWKKAENYVKKLQKRIVKAHFEGRQGKVKSLQWLLTHSFYGRALAVNLDLNSYGSRPKKCVQDAKGCFDNINHDWILNNIPLDKKILKKWLRSGYIETQKLFLTEKGTPQSSPISPVICNMVLDGLEYKILEKYHKTKIKGKAHFPKVNFVRYADDFIVTGETKELAENKTVITHITDGFNFLGCNVKWYNDKLLITLSGKNYKAVIDKIRGIIKKNPTLKQSFLIRKLNPVIRGWVNFHRHNAATKYFERLDYDIWRSLWRWCKRRHPKKSHKWIAQKYFHQVDNRIWTFSEELTAGKFLKLIYATDTKITRFIKTKSEATAYNSKWDKYFVERDNKRMKRDLKKYKNCSSKPLKEPVL